MKRAILFLAAVAGALWGLSAVLAAPAAERAEMERLEMMRRLLPRAQTFTEEASADERIDAVYRAENGCVFAVTEEGYAGAITLWIGVDEYGHVTGITVRDMAETPGLGQRALTDTAFLAQYLGTHGTVDALSGATVTTKAITRAVDAAVGYQTGADIGTGATSWG